MLSSARHKAVLFMAAIATAACAPLPSDLPSLVDAMNDCDLGISTRARQKVLRLYGTDGLLSALESGREGAMVQAAIGLRWRPDGRACDMLLAATDTRHDVALRNWATFSLSAYSGRGVEARLRWLADDAEEAIVYQASEAIGFEGPRTPCESPRTRPR